jgi:hypothetical protein
VAPQTAKLNPGGLLARRLVEGKTHGASGARGKVQAELKAESSAVKYKQSKTNTTI